MQVQAVNRRAQQQYATFVAAMDQVLEALQGLDPLIAQVDESEQGTGWSTVTRDELTAYRIRAVDELERLRATAKKYEANLVSRDWRL